MASRAEKDAEAWARWQEPLSIAIEVLLLDHVHEIDTDPDFGELAYCYEQITGWTAEGEAALMGGPNG